MAIRGNLSEANLADVLQLLALGQKTGCLNIARDGNFGTVHFVDGRIVHAGVFNRPDRLGERVVREGLLGPEAWARLRAQVGAVDDRTLAALLLQRDDMDAERLCSEYRAVVEETVYHLFGWTQGTFTFAPLDVSDADPPIVSLSPDALLLEGARRVDEWTVIARKIPSLDLLFETDPVRVQQREASLSPLQDRLLTLLDGTLDVQGLIDRTGEGEYEVGKALYGLITAGFVQRVGRSIERAHSTPDLQRAEHRKLGLAFYQSGLYDDAAREFRRVLALNAQDDEAQFHLGLILARRGEWQDAMAQWGAMARQPDAPASVFHNLGSACDALGDLEGARHAYDEAARRRGDSPDPRTALMRAMLALRCGRPDEAETLLGTARTHWRARQPDAAWYHVAGLAAALAGREDHAIALLEEGIALHPRAVALYNNLAVLQEQSGRAELAAHTLEHALLQDPDSPHLHKNLGDYHYRAQRYDEAFDALARTVRLAPDHGPDVYLKLGNIHYRRGALPEARAAWEHALRLDPAHPIARSNLVSLLQAAQVA